MQNRLSLESNQKDIGKTFRVLIEGDSKRSNQDWMGRNSQFKVVVFPKVDRGLKPGEYVDVQIHSCTQGTLLGNLI
jgi:tRNA-2-methylthio-N6-dimethylallyladenosine synthase